MLSIAKIGHQNTQTPPWRTYIFQTLQYINSNLINCWNKIVIWSNIYKNLIENLPASFSCHSFLEYFGAPIYIFHELLMTLIKYLNEMFSSIQIQNNIALFIERRKDTNIAKHKSTQNPFPNEHFSLHKTFVSK